MQRLKCSWSFAKLTGGAAALVFASRHARLPDYLPHSVSEPSEIVRVDGHVVELVGSTGLA